MLLNKWVLLLLLPAILFSCRSKELVDSEIVDLPSHCYNGMRDADELGVDCGGACDDCFQVTPTCVTFTDSIYTKNEPGSGSANSYDFIDSVEATVENDLVIVTVSTENDQRLKIRFPSTVLDVTARYTVVDYDTALASNHIDVEGTFTYGEYEANAIDDTTRNEPKQLTNDYAYINYDENTEMYSVTFCNLSYWDRTKILRPYEVQLSFAIDFKF